MRRYEYKVVKVRGKHWWSTSSEDALVELLVREGRGGWRLVPLAPSNGLVGYHSVLLERAVD